MSDPRQVAEAHALRAAAAPHATLAALHAAPEWPQLSARLDALLAPVRRCTPAAPASATTTAGALRVAHWNLEHGNQYDAIERALRGAPGLADADLVTLNEVDAGMARSGNRDVAASLAAALGMHSAWAALFLESTRGRDDDLATAVPEDNAESLFGLAILSRWPITTARTVPLPGPAELLFERERMLGRFVALVCEVAHPVQPFVAATVHLEVHRTRAHRAAQMRCVLAALANEPRPVVLTGDWNTHTFDRGTRLAVLSAAWRLLASPARALTERFTHPDRGRHREALFAELAQAGFAWEATNDRAPTLGMRFGRLGEVHRMPGPLRALVTRGLTSAEQRARLRLDWIAARGFATSTARGRTLAGLDGPGRASDHAPIVAELPFAG